MSYTARGLIEYARSLADLQNTKFISYSDELILLNEAYRDIYSRYTESDGDFWVTELIINMSPAYNDPNNQYGYLIPLPADFAKIRTLSYNYGGVWYPCQKFAMSGRDYCPSQPQYRLINGNLWVIGAKQSYSQLKLEYYPPPAVLTAPDAPIDLLAAESRYNLPAIGSHVYSPSDSVFFYALGQVIKCQNLITGVTSTLYTAANPIAGLAYFAGYVFWLDTTANIIYRAPTDFVTTLVPVSTKTTVVNFSIQDGRIYYATATETRVCDIDGANDTLVLASTTTAYTVFGATYLTIAGGFITLGGVATAFPATRVLTDGTYVFGLSAARVFTRYKLSALGALVVDSVLSFGVLTVGSMIIDTYLSAISYQTGQAVSLVPDSVLSYPTVEVNEILAYTSASAYARKQTDTNKQATIETRLAALWERFWSVQKRDEYQNTRINNDYAQYPGNW